jgi:N-methylhydantoinase A
MKAEGKTMDTNAMQSPEGKATLSVAIDTGGTFTDVTLVDRATGELWKSKTPSTPHDPSLGFMQSIQKVLAVAGAEANRISHVFHGTTVATNAILEMRGAKSALLTTRGFKHVLEIGRHDIPRSANMYSWQKPARPIPPERIYEIEGRVDFTGAELTPLNEDHVRAAVRKIKTQEVVSIAVCYLHSYANGAQERRTREIILEEYPEALVSLSSEVLPTFREFERTMATVLNAYVMPPISGYVARLEGRLTEENIDGRLLLMKSSGGVTGVETVRREPVHTALSGPAGGVVGAELVGELAGERHLITLDIGGTSADICLINGGHPSITTEGSVGTWPVHLPMIDIHTIGAGGGSIARATDGVLVVGPQSAGAVPGPVCYRRSGEEPTVTDAHLVLGHLPRSILNGEMSLDLEGAKKAIEEKIARPLGIDVYEAASGIIDIANNNMVGAIRVVSVEKGYDPAQFALVPFGGAGPLHGSFIGRLLGMKSILVPPGPGVLSSLGLLISNLRNEFTRTCLLRPPVYELDKLAAGFRELHGMAEEWLTSEQIPAEGREIRWVVGLRYIHQGFELDVPWPSQEVNEETLSATIDEFHKAHERLYTFGQPDTPVEVAGLRVEAIGKLTKPKIQKIAEGVAPEEAVTGQQQVYFEGDWLNCKIYDRARLRSGATIMGPAILEQLDATTYMLPGQKGTVDAYGNFIIQEA